MAESLGVALLELGTDDRKLKKGLGKAEKSAKRTAGRIKKAFAGIATAALITGLKRAFDTAIDRLDNIAKSADKIGIATDALQELRVAADLSGISSQALDTALRKFSRSVDEAGQGVIEYKEVFDRLGISVNDASGEIKPITDLVGEVADAMNKVGNTTSRAAIALDLFGRSGLDMLNLFQGGAAGIDELRRAARELGIIFDEKLIREAVRTKDELTLLSKTIEFDLTVALRQLGPLIIGITELLVFLSTSIGDTVTMWRELLGLTSLEFPQIAVQEEMDKTFAQIDRLDIMLESLAEARRKFKEGEKGAVSKDDIGGINEAFAAANLERTKLVDEYEGLQLRMFELRFPPEPDDPVKPAKIKPIDNDAEDERQDIIDDITDSIKAQIESLNEQTLSFELQGGALAKVIALSRANLELKTADIKLSKPEQIALDANIEKLGAKADRLIAVADAHRKAEDAARAHALGIERMGDAFAHAVLDVRDLESAIASFQSLLMQFLSQQASSGLSSLFTGIASSIAGAIFGGSSNIGGSANISQALPASSFGGGSIFTATGAPREHGGSVQAGRAFIVGEKRPELFVPKTSGTIFPSVPGGGSKTVVNVFAPPGSTVDTERTQSASGAIEELNIIIDAATARNMRPGTQTNRALRAVYGQRQTLIAR